MAEHKNRFKKYISKIMEKDKYENLKRDERKI